MSKKETAKSETTTAPENKISRAQLLGCKVEGSVFDNLTGEKFAGKSVLKLEPGEAAGPLVVSKIERDVVLNKKLKPTDVYYAATADGKETSLPVAAGFTMKAKESNLAVGDTLWLKRVEDYISKTFKKPGQAYEIVITARAKSKK